MDDEKKTKKSDEMAYLYLLIIQKKSNLVILNTLNPPTAQRFKKGKRFFVRYIMMYLCHLRIHIYDFEIIFHSGSTFKSKDERTHSIRDPQN